jgi:hypothetical protein
MGEKDRAAEARSRAVGAPSKGRREIGAACSSTASRVMRSGSPCILVVLNEALSRVIEAARQAGLEPAVLILASQVFAGALRSGYGENDISAIALGKFGREERRLRRLRQNEEQSGSFDIVPDSCTARPMDCAEERLPPPSPCAPVHEKPRSARSVCSGPLSSQASQAVAQIPRAKCAAWPRLCWPVPGQGGFRLRQLLRHR